MKILSFLLIFLLASVGAAYAQQPAAAPVAAPDSGQADRYIYVPEPNHLLTAADSARERARKENARRLRLQSSKANAALPPTTQQAVSAPTGVTAPNTREAPVPTPQTLEKDAQRREEAARQAEKADKKREKTLYKRAKKAS